MKAFIRFNKGMMQMPIHWQAINPNLSTYGGE